MVWIWVLLKIGILGFCLQKMFNLNFCLVQPPSKYGRMLKAPPLKSSDLHLSVIKCNCRTYEKKQDLLFWGHVICLTISSTSDQCRAEVCPEIEKIHLSGLCWSASLSNFFCMLPLLQTSVFEFRTEKCRTKDLRGGAFSLRQNMAENTDANAYIEV